MIVASCSDLKPLPAWSGVALQQQAATISRTGRYHTSVLMDDMDCPDRCAELVANAGKNISCHGIRQTIADHDALAPLRDTIAGAGTATSEQLLQLVPSRGHLKLWKSSRPPDTLNRPDVLAFAARPEHACAAHLWVVEPDVAFAGDWGAMLRSYDDEGASTSGVDVLAAEKPDALHTSLSKEGWNGSSAVDTMP